MKKAEDYQWFDDRLAFEDMPNFVKLPIRRGIFEIRNELKLIQSAGGIVCGGYVRYCASPKQKPFPAKDLDIYSKDEETFQRLKEAFSYLPRVHENAMALTFGGGDYCPDVQLIKPFEQGRIKAVGDMEEILSNFDFTVVRCAILDEETALVDRSFVHDELHNRLRLSNIHCPVSSTLRCIKYAKKGYWLGPFESMKLFIDWDNRDAEYKAKLIEYFTKLEEKEELTQEAIDELEALLRID
jgi:hypothetical protein